MFAIPVVFSAALVGGGLYSYYRTKQTAQENQIRQNQAIKKGWDTIKHYYPKCHENILNIYEAAGLIPLIIKELEKTQDGAELCTINKITQEILSTNENPELDDISYLSLIQTRLESAYQKAGLPEQPSVDITNLRVRFLNPLDLETPVFDEAIDTTKIVEARKNLNAYIKTSPKFSDPHVILNYLQHLAKEMNELAQACSKQIDERKTAKVS